MIVHAFVLLFFVEFHFLNLALASSTKYIGLHGYAINPISSNSNLTKILYGVTVEFECWKVCSLDEFCMAFVYEKENRQCKMALYGRVLVTVLGNCTAWIRGMSDDLHFEFSCRKQPEKFFKTIN